MSSFMAFGSRRISLTERSRSSFDLVVSLLCVGFSLSLSLSLSSGNAVGACQCKVQALSAGICVGACRWCRVTKKVFTSRVR
jgi:hypothetical protein